jgi:hypothetical protein
LSKVPKIAQPRAIRPLSSNLVSRRLGLAGLGNS